jgi:hypothetical protein
MSGHSIRRRATGSTSAGPDYPNYLPSFREPNDVETYLPPPSPSKHHRAASLNGSFLSEKIPIEWCTEDDQDVKTDVLFPRYNASKDDNIDIAAFNRMVQDHNRKLSTGTLQLSRTLSRQNKLYGYSKYDDMTPLGVRFNIYSSQKNSNISTSLDQLLTEEGKKALEAVVDSKGWWVDVLCPSPEEMRVLSKVKILLTIRKSRILIFLFLLRLFVFTH